MLKLSYNRKTFYVGVEDEQAIAAIKVKYGCSTDSDAVRFAVRLVAASPLAQLPKKKR